MMPCFPSRNRRALWLGALLALILAASGCAGKASRGRIVTSGAVEPACRGAFPSPPFKVVHNLTGEFPGGRRAVLVGVTKAESAKDYQALIMSAEGLVLLDAERVDGRTEVHRALPPFDQEAFAAAMLDDVGLMLLPPSGNLGNTGLDAEGRRVCIWRDGDAGRVEMVVEEDGGYTVHAYNEEGNLTREVVASPPNEAGFPAKMTLKASGAAGYTLDAVFQETQS